MTNEETTPERRLAAIMATDVVEYTRSMQSDEVTALAALATIRETIEKQIKQHRGRIANTAGDSVLAEFGSAVEAVSCAMALQKELASHKEEHKLQLRIGVHIGDVVNKNGDLFGTAVNVASRLEGISEPSGIVVSAAVRDAIAGRLLAYFSDLGLKNLKGIEEPLRAYALSSRAIPSLPGVPRAGNPPPLPDKPSIAVLPFDNLSGDREQEYFADGIVEEIITALSRFRGLFVIARNSSFAYKGRVVDVKQVGRELGVRYILEGSVRKAGSRVRISGQLVDSAMGVHLWADRFEGSLDDIFDLQDQVTASVTGAILPRLEEAEIERTKLKPTESLDACDYYLRGLAIANQLTREGNDEALRLFNKAIQRDPDFALAHARAAYCYVYRKANGWMVDRAQEVAAAALLARGAVEMGRDDALSLSYGGHVLAYVVGDVDDGAAFVDRALVLNPNLAVAWGSSGWMKICLGQPDQAIEHIARALRLSPLDPRLFVWQCYTGLAHFCAGRYDEAVTWAERSLRDKPNFATALRVLAASHALAGRLAEGQKAIARLRQSDPELRVSTLGDVMSPFRRPEDRDKSVEGLRLAGLPE